MAIKHTTSIFISKFGLVYKIIVYFLLVVLIVGAIAFAVAHPAIQTIGDRISNTGFVSHIKSGFGKLFRGNGDFLQDFSLAHESFGELRDVVTSAKAEWTLLTTTLLISLVVVTFLLSLSALPFSDILRNFMSSKSEYGFLSNLVANGARAALYALLYTLTVFVVQIAIFAFSFWLFLRLTGEIGVFSISVSYLVLTLLSALKSTLMCGWLPATVTENIGVLNGFAVGIRAIAKRFLRSFWTFVFLSWILTALISLFGIMTFGAGFIIGVPSAFIIHRIAELVLYFDACGYHYYIDAQTVR